MDTEHLASWLEQRLPRISELNLSPQSLRVAHILNWGGLVNHSFSVDDGSAQYHLKITNEPESIAKLQRWRIVHHLLEKRYRAPKLIQWVDFPEIGFAGLLFEHLNGKTVTFNHNPVLVGQLIELAGRLHNDAEVQFRLKSSGSEKTYLDHFVETYVDRFAADLETVSADRPPFISGTLCTWMQSETDRLHETARRLRSFHDPATEPVHGDLNENNVLMTTKDWFVLDWDDLAIGDPAIDMTILAWPMVWDGRDWRDFCISETELAQRMEVCFRAQLLDEVIDPLADYIEARAVPSKQAEIRLVKRERHEAAFEKYRRLWTE